ncbi:MAG TPA: glycosyltransferase 87 family protein [Candidatus Dormibacteraeota bacterium]|nr:glycosyltransferase 87 family protein [Candidatus Dormibacteraeota bacterium]
MPPRLPRSPLHRHGETLALLLLGVPSAAIGWQIARAWDLPDWLPALLAGLLAVLVAAAVAQPRLKELAAAAAVVVLYALPILGAIARWHLVPSSKALIGDGAYQIQLARNLLMRGVDPYGFDYTGTGLERAPWGQPFPNPALHHLDYWPGTIVLPLPLQAAFQFVAGWWDERIWLLVAGAGVFLLLRWLLPGPAGRVAVLAFFLIPGHNLLAVLGDNDLPMIGLLLAATLAIARRRFLLAASVIGLAIATKQTALIALPVLVAFSFANGVSWRSLARYAGLAALTVLALIAPFVVWNASAFVRDTVLYNVGSGAEAYPIQGIGLSSWLLQAGIIRGARDAFPFLLIQLPLVLAVWVLGWRWLRHHRLAGDATLWMGLAFFVFLFTNRFAQPTYLLLGIELIAVGVIGRLAAARRGPVEVEFAQSAA